VDSDIEVYTHVPRRTTAIPNRLVDMNNNFLNIVLVSD